MRHFITQPIKLLSRYILIVINELLIRLPIKKNLIIFESFNGQSVNDNPAAIYKEIKILHPELASNLFFGIKGNCFSQVQKDNPDVQLLKRWSLKWILVMARANYWIFNSRLPLWWHKNAQTVYVQTWHGTPLKKLGLDIKNVEIPGTSTEKYHQDFKKEAARWNYLIAPNAYSETIFKRAFGFKNKFIRSGYPRNDVLFTTKQTEINSLKKRLVGEEVAQVILYAPTWRDDNFIYKGRYRFNLPFDLKEFFEAVPPHTMLIIRPHYLVKDHIDIRGFEDRVKILAETDISQLYLISDLLITDYSSVMFDFANLKRPILFFPYDLKHYAGELRGFYFDYLRQCPGPIVTKRSELYSQLRIFSKNKSFPNYQEQINDFEENFLAWEHGNAAKQVIEAIGI